MNAPQSAPQDHHSQLREELANVRFIKISGPTGDWIVFHEPSKQFNLTRDHVVFLCDRFSGVGASGVVVVTVEPQTKKQDPKYFLEAWSDDGQAATILTEAARAATHALAALGKIPNSETTHHVFDSSIGIITTVYTPSYVGVDIGQWSYTAPETATAAGSDTLVMAAGLTDPRPGLSIRTQTPHITVAVESEHELFGIDLAQRPSIEPAVTEPTGLNFVVPQDPVLADGMGQLVLRHLAPAERPSDLGSAAAAAASAFQIWSGLTQLNIWNVATPRGEIVVQLHEQQRMSTFVELSTVFFGRL